MSKIRRSISPLPAEGGMPAKNQSVSGSMRCATLPLKGK